MRKLLSYVVILLCSPAFLIGYVYQTAAIWFALGCDRVLLDDRGD